VTPAGVEAGVASLADGGTPARFVIIDDGWQSVQPDDIFKKKVDHISGMPPPPPPPRKALAAAAADGGEGGEGGGEDVAASVAADDEEGGGGGGVMARVGASLASGVESMYWHGLHATPYASYGWRTLRFLGQYVLAPAIRAAVSTASCFNHRVSGIEANIKFQDEGGGDGEGAGGVLGKKRKADDGLGRVVARIKQLGVHHVYCWHALFGYWGGLHPNEPGVAKYGPKMQHPEHTPGVLTVEPSQAWDPITVGGVGTVARDKWAQFYNELHAYLAAAGVDGVKVDGQAVVGGLGQGLGGGPALAKSLHQALEASVTKNFPTNGLINCMCHSSVGLALFTTLFCSKNTLN
jgi:raffinose synthase